MNGKSTGLLPAVMLMKKDMTRKIIPMIGEMANMNNNPKSGTTSINISEPEISAYTGLSSFLCKF